LVASNNRCSKCLQANQKTKKDHGFGRFHRLRAYHPAQEEVTLPRSSVPPSSTLVAITTVDQRRRRVATPTAMCISMIPTSLTLTLADGSSQRYKVHLLLQDLVIQPCWLAHESLFSVARVAKIRHSKIYMRSIPSP